LFSLPSPAEQKASDIATEDQEGPPVIDHREPGFNPHAHSVLVYPKQLSDLFHGVTPMDLDAPRIKPLHPVEPALMRATISSTRQAVMRGPSLTGWG
jgi:hypothetical protein